MFRFRVTVAHTDGQEGTYDLGFADLCEFEEVTKIGVPVAFQAQNMKLQHLATIGWIAEKNSGLTVKPLAEWRKGVASVEFQDANPPTSEAG